MKTSRNKIIALLLISTLFSSIFLASCKEEYDHTVDVANPEVVSFNPVSGVGEVSINSNLVLTFNEPVKKGQGNITIATATETKTLDVNSDFVTISEDGRIVTIKPGELGSDEQYTISIERGVLVDLLGNQFMGTTSSKPWTFATAGDVGPIMIGTTPEHTGTDGSLIKLEMNFLSEVTKGAGNIAVYNAAKAKIADFSVATNAINVQGKKVTINLATPLEFDSEYYVTVDNGAITDLNGKKYKGFSDDSGWKFKTTVGSGSALAIHLPMDGNFSDISGNKFDAFQGLTSTTNVEFVNDPERGRVVHFPAGAYAVLPKHNLLRPKTTESFSFNIWFKFQGTGSDPVLFSNSDWDSGGNLGMVLATDGALTYAGEGTEGRGWLLKITGGGRMDWRAGEATPKAPALADNKWHMVTAVLDQETKLLHMYIDGKEYIRENHATSRDLKTLTGLNIWDDVNDYPFTIWEDGTGKYNASSDTRKHLTGYVDDVRVYNKALTPAEIAVLLTR